MSERKLPTRPGWWWRRGNHGPYIEEVDGDQNHALFLAIDGSDVVDDGTWLAPIPGPAVLAALAECAMAWNEIDERNAIAAKRGPDVPVAASARTARAIDRLRDAIRAERDGAA